MLPILPTLDRLTCFKHHHLRWAGAGTTFHRARVRWPVRTRRVLYRHSPHLRNWRLPPHRRTRPSLHHLSVQLLYVHHCSMSLHQHLPRRPSLLLLALCPIELIHRIWTEWYDLCCLVLMEVSNDPISVAVVVVVWRYQIIKPNSRSTSSFSSNKVAVSGSLLQDLVSNNSSSSSSSSSSKANRLQVDVQQRRRCSRNPPLHPRRLDDFLLSHQMRQLPRGMAIVDEILPTL